MLDKKQVIENASVVWVIEIEVIGRMLEGTCKT